MTVKEFKEKLNEFNPDDGLFIEYCYNFYNGGKEESTEVYTLSYTRQDKNEKNYEHVILCGRRSGCGTSVKELLDKISQYNDNDLISVKNPMGVHFCENSFENNRIKFETYNDNMNKVIRLFGYKTKRDNWR